MKPFLFHLLDRTMQDEEARLLAERRRAMEAGQAAWSRLLWTTFGLAVAILTTLFGIILRQRSVSRAAATLLDAANHELEQRTAELKLLTELADKMQSNLSWEEANQVIAHYGRALFPHCDGAVYLTNASRNLVEKGAEWGETGQATTMLPGECWAMRGSRPHVAWGPDPLWCQHVQPHPATSICVPMQAQGEAVGVAWIGGTSELSRGQQDLAVTLAEQVALALSNLKLRDTLRYQAIRHPLTGLFNRRYMEESLHREIRRAERASSSVGVVMIDIDHFKAYNDMHGHEAGDELLRALGAFLARQVRDADIACHYGGEEFTLILPDATLDVTVQRADAIREKAHTLEVEWRGQRLNPVTLSMGVACYPPHDDPATVLRAADQALYKAKKSGRNKVCRDGEAE